MTGFTSQVREGTPALHYLEGPSAGPPLLLLHGVARDARDWEPVLPELAHSWHVFALDHRGHGHSGHTPGHYLVTDYAADAIAFVRQTFSKPAVVMGHSLGAMAALAVAAECPTHVAAVVLEDPPFHTMGRRIGETTYRALFAGMQQVARQGSDAMTNALAEIRLPARLGDLRDRASLEFSASCLRSIDPAIFDPLVTGQWLDAFDYQSRWRRVWCPALLLQGDPMAGGTFSNDDVALAVHELVKSRHVQFAGVGHQIHRTQPAEFLEAFAEFEARFISKAAGRSIRQKQRYSRRTARPEA